MQISEKQLLPFFTRRQTQCFWNPALKSDLTKSLHALPFEASMPTSYLNRHIDLLMDYLNGKCDKFALRAKVELSTGDFECDKLSTKFSSNNVDSRHPTASITHDP